MPITVHPCSRAALLLQKGICCFSFFGDPSLTSTLTIHLGRSWYDGLGDLKPLRTHEALYTSVAYIDVTRGVHTLFRMERPARVMPLVFSWIDQLARANHRTRRFYDVGDGGTLFSLRLDGETVELRDDSQQARVGRGALLDALTQLLTQLARDIEPLGRHEVLLPILEQMQRAHAVLDRLREGRTSRNHRSLHVASALDAPDDRSFEREMADETSTADATLPTKRPIRRRLHTIRLLKYRHAHVLRLASDGIHEVFFTPDDALVLCAPDHAQLADAQEGALLPVPIPPPSKAQRRAVRHVSESLIYEDKEGITALWPHEGAWVNARLQGARYTHRIKTLVRTTHEVLAYLQGTTVFDGPTGVPLLHEVSSLIARKDAQDRVVGWYALDHTLQTIWWDGGGEAAPFYTASGTCVKLVAHRYGAVAHVVNATSRRLLWLRFNGTVGWSRSLPSDVEEFRRGGTLEVFTHPDLPHLLCVHVVAAYRWWAFAVHTRTQLATLVLRNQESDAVRLVWTSHALVCASGENLRVYPLVGRLPKPLWQDRVPKTLGVLAPVFPLAVRGELLAHATDHVAVRRVHDGSVLTTYRSDWTAIFDLRFSDTLDVVVAAAEPGKRIDLYHAAPAHWIALV